MYNQRNEFIEYILIQKYYAHMYVNGKMRPVKTILGMGD
jgi:hypothetical protein